MSGNTRQAFQDFIKAIERLSVAISSVSGTDCCQGLMMECENLRETLDKDETILS